MNKKQKRVLVRILVTVALLVLLGGLTDRWNLPQILYLIPYLVIGYDILRKAVRGIWNRQMFDENFLMAVATEGAIALGDYPEGVAVMLFYQIGELFQSYAVGKSRRNISQLMDIRPDYANVEGPDGLMQVDPDEVEIGTVIVIQPGEKVPIDGVVTEGATALNTSALTGESLPREVGPGDEVISGCINLNGLVKVRGLLESLRCPGSWIWWRMPAPGRPGRSSLSPALPGIIRRLSASVPWRWRSFRRLGFC